MMSHRLHTDAVPMLRQWHVSYSWSSIMMVMTMWWWCQSAWTMGCIVFPLMLGVFMYACFAFLWMAWPLLHWCWWNNMALSRNHNLSGIVMIGLRHDGCLPLLVCYWHVIKVGLHGKSSKDLECLWSPVVSSPVIPFRFKMYKKILKGHLSLILLCALNQNTI